MAGFIVKHFTAGGNGYSLLFMFYVKDKDENILFKSTFFRTAHQQAEVLADEEKKVIVLWENNTIIKWFYPEGEEPFYI